MKISAGDLNKGDFMDIDGNIFQVQRIDHNYQGRGQANLKMKLKNVSAGTTVEKTLGPNNSVEKIVVDTILMQYLYKDAQNLTFMNEQSYEQLELPIAMAEGVVDYLKEGQSMYIMIYDGNALAIRPPQTVRLQIIESEDAVKGNTATNAKKVAIVETGAKVMVPLFIKKGELIVINPETGEYVERAN